MEQNDVSILFRLLFRGMDAISFALSAVDIVTLTQVRYTSRAGEFAKSPTRRMPSPSVWLTQGLTRKLPLFPGTVLDRCGKRSLGVISLELCLG